MSLLFTFIGTIFCVEVKLVMSARILLLMLHVVYGEGKFSNVTLNYMYNNYIQQFSHLFTRTRQICQYSSQLLA